MQLTAFDQCCVGAGHIKPTMLLHAHLPELQQALLQRGHGGRCAHGGPLAHRALLGRRANGSGYTAAAKEYPQELCRVLAAHFVARITGAHPFRNDRGITNWDSFVHLYQPLDDYASHTTHGPDTFHSRWLH